MNAPRTRQLAGTKPLTKTADRQSARFLRYLCLQIQTQEGVET